MSDKSMSAFGCIIKCFKWAKSCNRQNSDLQKKIELH